MLIPNKTETYDEFVGRVAALLSEPSTTIYIDTSFLMWLTKIGAESRTQLIGWLRSSCGGRVHIPTWTAHEYFRHHVARTIPSQLEKTTRDLAVVADRTFAELRPYLDGPLPSEQEDVGVLRDRLRDLLTGLTGVTRAVGTWKKKYNEHAAEVIAFINECPPCGTDVFQYMSTMDALSEDRFVGRVPPGFQDRGKESEAKPSSEEGAIGSNRWGDLMFWKEVLDHSRRAVAQCIVILSNDRKNDWFLNASEDSVKAAGRQELPSDRPVPRPHPMLEYEARSEAGVPDLVLLDSPYLAGVLKNIAPNQAQAFLDVAIVSTQPKPPTARQARAAVAKARIDADLAKQVADAEKDGFRFADSDRVAESLRALEKALYLSRQPVQGEVAELVATCRAKIQQQGNIVELLTADALRGFDHIMLVAFTRELHDFSLSETGWREAIVDLCSVLPELPPKTAGGLYLGLLVTCPENFGPFET